MTNDLKSTAPPKSDAGILCVWPGEGNEDAFAALYAAHRTKVYSFVCG